ncbi:MAG TPA: hypothetical protein VF440_09835 [Novosphingobium sp.]
MPYCIYTDRDVPADAGNWDHVIPLALGGHDDFVVWSDNKTNSDLGSHVDGKLRQDPLMVFALRNSGVKGHRGKAAVPTWKRAKLAGRPVQITWGIDKVTVWDARDRRELNEADVEGQAISAELKIDTHLGARFLGKVALGAGHFVYNEIFRRAVDCDALRKLALLSIDQACTNEIIRSSGIAICDRFHPDSQPGREGYLHRALTEASDRSMVICVPHDDAVAFHVGLVGTFVGTIVCPANTTEFPFGDEHDLGHVICLAPGNCERFSFRALAQDFYRATTDSEPPSPV